ncbi:IPT/TIG domain-containing protein [Streptomyces sp. NPDC005731]|uniref:IPT/TIG domain-containing protein n=1 Tax=Streptomyces sp. NPDC005731 TaxID=3157056 RepID=UPI00340663D1
MAAPVVSSISPNQGPMSGGNTVTLTGTGFSGATAVRFGGIAAISFTILGSTKILAVVPAGAGAVNVTVTTSEGTSAQTVTYTYVAAPSLSSLSPDQGPVSGGIVVTLTGANLSSATAVRFDAIAALSFTVVSATQISAVAPAHAAGAAAVTVTTAGGTSNSLTFSYVVAPSVTGLTPAQGPASGGTVVTLTGTNLSGATAVRFDGIAAPTFTVVSATEISAVTPVHAAGAAAVTVTTPGGISNPENPSMYFYYAAVPSLVSVTPTSGTTAGGTVVTITGTSLSGATAVDFDGIAATSFTVASSTAMTAVTPAHAAGTAAITVTTPGGTGNPLTYDYYDTPTLSTLTPDLGPIYAGNTVTLTGTSLTTTTDVRFGGAAASFTVLSPTEVTAVAPAGPAGPVSVTVVTTAGVSNGLTYTRVAGPGI